MMVADLLTYVKRTGSKTKKADAKSYKDFVFNLQKRILNSTRFLINCKLLELRTIADHSIYLVIANSS